MHKQLQRLNTQVSYPNIEAINPITIFKNQLKSCIFNQTKVFISRYILQQTLNNLYDEFLERTFNSQIQMNYEIKQKLESLYAGNITSIVKNDNFSN